MRHQTTDTVKQILNLIVGGPREEIKLPDITIASLASYETEWIRLPKEENEISTFQPDKLLAYTF